MGKTSLKQVLKSFLDHFDQMEASRESEDTDLYLDEFHSLKDLTESLKRDAEYTCSEGLKDVNRRKNRYKDILPYDRSRVIISEYPGVPGSDYINANYVKGSTGSSCAYIASQGPLPNTLVDFWRMIWECETTVIIMACNESESGKYKCENYWPSNCDEEQQYGNITIKLVKWKQVCPDFLVRTLEVTHEKTERTVIQFHYSTWPDHGVPTAVTPILQLVCLMRDVQATEARPILVHCSAGCGRTGTICSIDYVWALLRAGKLTDDFSLYSIIKEMRRQRIAMVQTLEQYMLCYKAVAALFEQQLKIIDAHTYENLDEDGEPLILKSISFTDDSSSEEAMPSQPFPPPMITNEQTAPKTVVKEWKETEQREPQKELVPCRFELPKKAPSLDSLIQPTLISPSTTSIYGPDKLVGKATVIRRPSIAHLKAMFENMQVSDDHQSRRERSERPDRRNRRLQRSQSTKENSSRIFSLTRNFASPPMSISHEAAAIAAQAFCMRDSSLELGHNSSSSCVMTYGSSSRHTTNSSEDGLRVSDGTLEDEETNDYTQRQTNSAISMQSSADTGYSAASGPPKPPRTYEYHKNPNRLNNTENGGGRIIVTVAQPKSNHHQQPLYLNQVPNNNINYANFQQQKELQSQMQKIRERAKHISTPNLASFSTFNPHHFNQTQHLRQGSMAFDQQQQFNHRPSPPQYQSYDLRSPPEPIYQTLVTRTMAPPPTFLQQQLQQQQQLHQHRIQQQQLQQQIHQHQMIYQQQQQRIQQLNQQGIYGTIGFQRVLPPVPQQQPQLLPKLHMPSNRISATPVGPVIANYEDIYEVPKKRPILANEVNRRLPVTYVRPQPNPGLAGNLGIESHTTRLNNPSRAESRSDQQSLKQKSHSSKDLQKDVSKSEKKSGFSFSVATLFSRKKKPLNKSAAHSSSAQNLTSTNLSLPGLTSGVIRPPHSHRFSPPAQWTQV